MRRKINRLAKCLLAWGLAVGLGGLSGVAVAPPAAAQHAGPALWQVTGPKGSLYVMGSVHVLTESDKWMNSRIEAAFNSATCLALEIDLASITPQDIAARMQMAGLYDPKGGGLKAHVSTATYRRLMTKTAQMAVSPASLDRFRPWLVGLVLTSILTQAQGYEEQYGVDYTFMMRARAKHLPIVGLETLEDQVRVLSFDDGESDDKTLNDVLDDLDRSPGLIRKLSRAWLKGDMETIAKKVAEEFADRPKDYDRLIAQRNRKWAPELARMLKRGKHCFVVVGAGHLVGKASVLTLLKAAGYTVARQ
ncbi:MAG TPA: TraB/GumN family protein [Alphaproteobacteria bacterium]|nr:TraB/GumN family protein [Alphaproteobacteria bacterium]